MEELAYPCPMKEFYQKMHVVSRSNEIACLVKNVRITITKTLIHDIHELESCVLQIFLHKAHPTLDGYDPSKACRRVRGKDIKNITK